MWRKRRHKVVTEILRFVMSIFLKLKYKITYDKKVSFPNGAIIVSNHVTAMDEFMIGLLFKEPIYYMASVDIFNHLFVGKLIKFLVNPIPKEKSKKSDLMAIRNCMNVAKEDGNICIFVEGNRTFDGNPCFIDESIAKLVKLVKKPLVICNIDGGFGTDPRWSNKLRKGKMKVSIKETYDYDELKDKSTSEVFDIIKNGITVDNINFHNSYKSNRKAEYLERVTYICPVCKKLHTLSSKGNLLKCSSCGLEVTYNEDLSLSSNKKEFEFKYLSEWYNYQLDYVRNSSFKDNELIYKEDVKLVLSRKFKIKKKVGIGVMNFYADRFVFDLNTEIKEFFFKDIEAITILGRKKMGIYLKDETYQVLGNKRINLLKYMHMFYFNKNKIEGVNKEYWGI